MNVSVYKSGKNVFIFFTIILTDMPIIINSRSCRLFFDDLLSMILTFIDIILSYERDFKSNFLLGFSLADFLINRATDIVYLIIYTNLEYECLS